MGNPTIPGIQKQKIALLHRFRQACCETNHNCQFHTQTVRLHPEHLDRPQLGLPLRGSHSVKHGSRELKVPIVGDEKFNPRPNKV